MAYAIKAPARYVQGPGELDNLGLNTKKIGTKFFTIVSASGQKRFGDRITASLAQEEHTAEFSIFHGEATKDEVAAKIEECRALGCDAVIGAGGGKVLDTAKAVADGLDLPCVIVPTAASNDAPCTSVAVLYNDAGVVIKALVTKHDPELILVDTELIAQAPERLFACGLGDALSTYFEARACKKNGVKCMARGQVSNTGMMMARLCYDLLIQSGKKALDAVRNHEVNQDLENAVEASIYLSGVGFVNGGLAVAHAVNDGLAYEPQCHGMYHGEKVSFGVMTQLVLENGDPEEFEQVKAFMKSTGLPMTLGQLGIKEINPETLHKVAEIAAGPKESSKNLIPDITADDIYNAMLKADEIGREYLAR